MIPPLWHTYHWCQLFCGVSLPQPSKAAVGCLMAPLSSFVGSGAAVFSQWCLFLVSQRFTPVVSILHILLDVSKSGVH